jgi:hypothetical protein
MNLHYTAIVIRFGLICIIVCFSQCKKFVQTDPPATQLVTASVFNNNATATAAQIGIYIQMASNNESSNMEIRTGLLGDELTNYTSNTNAYYAFYTNAMTAVGTTGPWTNAYKYIYQANSVIAALQNNGAISPAAQQQLLGEAKFIRAFWYFYLTSFYGDVALVTSTSYTINASTARSPQTQIYQQMISDLKDALNTLSINYVDATDTTITTERTRPTKWAAAAMLARIYLYSGDYADAVVQSTSVINNNNLYRLVGLSNDSVFKANSLESIWQLAVPQPASSFDTPDGYFFILNSAPGGAVNCCAISTQLMQSFELGDARKKYWINSFQAGTVTYSYPYKYNIRTVSTIEYTMVLRLAEQYLIRAEAEAQLNNLSAAAVDLNFIRRRAGLPVISDSIATSQQQLLKSILHERQVELFTEWGQRWIDLGRSGIGNAVMSAVTPQKGGTWNPDGHQLLFPIPQTEINVDAKLTQNTGY